MARHGDDHRGGGKREPGDEAGDAAEAAADEVIDERGGDHAHQGLRNQDAERVEAEHAGRQRLHPQRQRRLVHGHQPGLVQRDEEKSGSLGMDVGETGSLV